MQAAGYQNAMFVVGVAKAGKEENSYLLGGSCIVAPSGEIIALASTDGDEVIVARCDLDLCQYNRKALFDFAEHRQVQHYGDDHRAAPRLEDDGSCSKRREGPDQRDVTGASIDDENPRAALAPNPMRRPGVVADGSNSCPHRARSPANRPRVR